MFSDVPPDVAEYLEAVHTLNLEKSQQCEEQLAHLLGVLNGIGVQPVFLKGAAALIGRLYPSSGERMVSDKRLAKSHSIIRAETVQNFFDVGLKPGRVPGFERHPLVLHFVPELLDAVQFRAVRPYPYTQLTPDPPHG